MRAIGIVQYTFIAVGGALLAGALFWYQNTRTFVDSAAVADGTVVRLDPVRSSDSTTWRPVVQFKDSHGQNVEFSTSFSSSPPAYSPGDLVRVLYLPSSPHDAKIEGYMSLWGGATILGGIGSVFLSIGLGILSFTRIKQQRDEALRASGTPIQTDFQSVELNTSVRVNGRHPFRVLTQWQNPSTSQIHVFHSNNLWFDPTKYIGKNPITVYIDGNNPAKYYMDTSFLPKLAS